MQIQRKNNQCRFPSACDAIAWTDFETRHSISQKSGPQMTNDEETAKTVPDPFARQTCPQITTPTQKRKLITISQIPSLFLHASFNSLVLSDNQKVYKIASVLVASGSTGAELFFCGWKIDVSFCTNGSYTRVYGHHIIRFKSSIRNTNPLTHFLYCAAIVSQLIAFRTKVEFPSQSVLCPLPQGRS